jgi:hypothetical protein
MSLRANYLSFVNAVRPVGGKRRDLADYLRVLPVFPACSPLRFVWF